MEAINVVCLFWGDAYDISYVRNLKNATEKYLPVPHTFNILTNRRDLDTELSAMGRVIYVPDTKYIKPWWHKIWMFSSESKLSGQILYFDLDIIYTGDLSVFIPQTDQLHIIHDFNRARIPNINLSNSSIMSWPHSKYTLLWKQFNSAQSQYINTMHGDQDFIHKYATDRQWYPAEYAVSYKWEYLMQKNYGPNSRAIVFHGRPKPHEVEDKIVTYWLG